MADATHVTLRCPPEIGRAPTLETVDKAQTGGRLQDISGTWESRGFGQTDVRLAEPTAV